MRKVKKKIENILKGKDSRLNVKRHHKYVCTRFGKIKVDQKITNSGFILSKQN